MKLHGVRVGQPTTLEHGGRSVSSAFVKSLVIGPVRVGFTNLAGDAQADQKVHGGVDKAVYAYSFNAYAYWRDVRPVAHLGPGFMGENLTIDSFSEDEIYIGDTFALGTAVLQAAQPRIPCFKLGLRFGDLNVVRDFKTARRPGIYFRVLQEGEIIAGQDLTLIDREDELLSINEAFDVHMGRKPSNTEAIRYLRVKALTSGFRARLELIAKR